MWYHDKIRTMLACDEDFDALFLRPKLGAVKNLLKFFKSTGELPEASITADGIGGIRVRWEAGEKTNALLVCVGAKYAYVFWESKELDIAPQIKNILTKR